MNPADPLRPLGPPSTLRRRPVAALASIAATLALVGCGSSPPVADPDIEARFAEADANAEEATARRQAFERILTETDQVMARYTAAVLDSGAPKSDRLAESLEAHLRFIAREHFAKFMHAAENRDFPRNRAIALAAIGLSGRREALDPLLNGLGDDNPEIIGNATFGLAMLADPRTPPSHLARVVRDADLPEGLRGGAAWSLYRVQEAAVDKQVFKAIWLDIVDGSLEKVPPAVAVSALRGLGALGDTEVLAAVERFVSHPTPKVRQAAAIAIGRIGVPTSYTSLIALIGPAEDNPNVRLTARKALQQLAGGIDRGYDVQEWHRVFERG